MFSDQKANECALIQLPVIGDKEIGYISVAEMQQFIPFSIQRVYWIFQTPPSVERGNHAHFRLQQLIIAIHGSIEITCENVRREKFTFILEHPATALFIPERVWRTIRMETDAVLLCLASQTYNESDYIRDYTEFQKLQSESH